MAIYSGSRLSLVVLVALLVCLIPTTIGALLSAIGIAGMDRLVQHNVLAMSGRAVEAAGDVSTLLLDKTGTITFGNRQASEVVPVEDATRAELLRAAYLSSLADETPEGRSIIDHALAHGVDPGVGTFAELRQAGAEFVPFSASTRMSGVDLPDGTKVRKGAGSAVAAWVAVLRWPRRPRPALRGGRHQCQRRYATRRGDLGAGRQRPHPGCRPPQGHRQARDARALRPAAGHGHPHRDDHRRQPAHRRRPSPPRPASTTSSPRPPPRTRWP